MDWLHHDNIFKKNWCMVPVELYFFYFIFRTAIQFIFFILPHVSRRIVRKAIVQWINSLLGSVILWDARFSRWIYFRRCDIVAWDKKKRKKTLYTQLYMYTFYILLFPFSSSLVLSRLIPEKTRFSTRLVERPYLSFAYFLSLYPCETIAWNLFTQRSFANLLLRLRRQ